MKADEKGKIPEGEKKATRKTVNRKTSFQSIENTEKKVSGEEVAGEE